MNNNSNSFSHLSGSNGRGRGRAAAPKTQQRLTVPNFGVKSTPKKATPVPDKWNGTPKSSANRMLPQYQLPDDLDYISSEEESDIEEEVLIKLTSGYDDEGSAGIRSEIANLYSSSSSTCLVCISTIRHAEAIWSCCTCYSTFHLVCIQKWARDGIKAPTLLSDELFPNQDVPWYCPKCRHEFSKSQIPNKYTCFCGKVDDPKHDPWMAPHSCGDKCGRELVPHCGHACLLLCHPGKCPPCPKQVKANCFCGKKSGVIRRCGQAKWSCNSTCRKPLQCGIHTCSQPCHEGSCPPCDKVSVQPCRCERQSQLRKCLQFDWQCDIKVCGKELSCGFHTCKEGCHSGSCPPCPQSLRTTCSCGSTKIPSGYPCTEDTPTCQGTCDKPLACGVHRCTRLCHHGDCDSCQIVVSKTCRCGKTIRTAVCSAEVTCDRKCNAPKLCGKHACKKKCCPGDCAEQCDKQCGKTLPCKNHRCQGDCHSGRCYPCPERVEVACTCKLTRIWVACGRERTTRPPKCKKPCKLPSPCHHNNSIPHKCHPGNCPPCKQVCNLSHSQCEHTCQVTCHDHVKTDKGLGQTVVFQKLPCPPCSVLVPISCYGEHEVATLECSKVIPFSCLRPCGRQLPCGNHQCSKECHYTSEGCIECEEMCTRERACQHACTRRCHADPCPPCRQYTRCPCHCSILHLTVKCADVTGGKDLDTILSCGSNCSKTIACGHTCRLTCHAGACSSLRECKKKVLLRCRCGKRREEKRCNEVTGAGVTGDNNNNTKKKNVVVTPLVLPCDTTCNVVKEADNGEDVDLAAPNEGTKDNEKPFTGGKRKRKKKRSYEDEREPWVCERYSRSLAIIVAAAATIIGLYFCTLD